MSTREPRMSAPTLKLLRQLLVSAGDQNSGAAISKATGVGAGTLYPLLARLEEAGWVEGQWENIDPKEAARPKRRFYKLTGVGATRARAALQEFQLPSTTGALAWNS